jgi:hypothetical protein
MEIGPVLGILSIPRVSATPFMGNQNESFAEILITAEKMNCIAFVFSPFDIDWSKNAIWGYRLINQSEPSQWERHLFPLPSVIYNRIPNRTIENREDVLNSLSILKQKYGSRFFNPFFLDKWSTHAILCSNEQTAVYVPETRRLDHSGIINKMLNKYSTVYLKPTANSLGNEIIKVVKNPQGQFCFIHQTLNRQPREGLVLRCDELMRELPLTEWNPLSCPARDTPGYLQWPSLRPAPAVAKR